MSRRRCCVSASMLSGDSNSNTLDDFNRCSLGDCVGVTIGASLVGLSGLVAQSIDSSALVALARRVAVAATATQNSLNVRAAS